MSRWTLSSWLYKIFNILKVKLSENGLWRLFSLLWVVESRKLNKRINKEKSIIVCMDGLLDPSWKIKSSKNILFFHILQNVLTLLGPPHLTPGLCVVPMQVTALNFKPCYFQVSLSPFMCLFIVFYKTIIQEKIENISSALSSFENYRDNFICSNKFNKLVILENLLTLFIPISLKNYLYL